MLRAMLIAVAIAGFAGTSAHAASCGNDASGYERWKAEFSAEARARGVSQKALAALAATGYSTKTIRADRGQKSFRLSLQQFMAKRGADTIVRQGRRHKANNAALLASIESTYGVPPGPLVAIWGMETAFGGFMGDINILSSVATLAYDCRRSAFFTGHLYAALDLIGRGWLSPNAIGAAHGEIGQTQFLAGNLLKYGADGDGNGRVDLIRSRADALASTARFLKAHGWRRGAGYQPGEPNFRALQAWNAAGVYQQAIAIIGRRIDE